MLNVAVVRDVLSYQEDSTLASLWFKDISIPARTTESVSYTHLDVYKRQHVMCLLIYLLPGRKEIMSFVIRLCLKLLPNCHGGITVSYTHLDVYKRQG